MLNWTAQKNRLQVMLRANGLQELVTNDLDGPILSCPSWLKRVPYPQARQQLPD